jgi:hypothetical protein
VTDRIVAKAIFISGSYDYRSEEAAIEPFAKKFHLIALIQRAALRYRSGHIPAYGDQAKVADIIARLCRFLKVPHLLVWEEQRKPTPGQVRRMLEAFISQAPSAATA